MHRRDYVRVDEPSRRLSLREKDLLLRERGNGPWAVSRRLCVFPATPSWDVLQCEGKPAADWHCLVSRIEADFSHSPSVKRGPRVHHKCKNIGPYAAR